MNRSLLRPFLWSRGLIICTKSFLFVFAFLMMGGDGVSAAAADSDTAGSWAQFRGPARSGATADGALARHWPESGPEILWKRSIGQGFSAPTVVGDKLYTVFAEGETEFLAAFSAATGDELWRREIGASFQENFGNGPRSTPTWSRGILYVLGSSGRLLAARAEDGSVSWQIELTETFPILESQALVAMAPTLPGPQLPVFGYTSSPLLVDDLVIVQTGAGSGRSVAAFDRASGAARWSALDDEIGYASPIEIEIDGQRQVLVLTGADLVALSLEGQELWRFPWAPTPSQPIFVAPDRILVSTVNEVGAKLLKIHHTDGTYRPEVLWENPRFRNNWNSSVLHEGKVYGFDNATFRCLDVETGEFCWSHRGLGQGTVIVADGLLFPFSDQGELFLAEASAEGFETSGSLQVLTGRSWTAPVLAGGVVYVRNQEEMAAIAVRGPKS